MASLIRMIQSEKSQRCWYDHHEFVTPIIQIPIRETSQHDFEGFGCFCSFECALAYLNHTRHTLIPNPQKVCFLLQRLFKKQFGMNAKIGKASDFRTLSAYGGWLSIGEFRENLHKTKYQVLPPHVIPIDLYAADSSGRMIRTVSSKSVKGKTAKNNKMQQRDDLFWKTPPSQKSGVE